MHRGYIKLWRKLKDNPMWLAEKFTVGQAWVDLLMLANHKKNTVVKRGIIVTLEPGQVLAGEQYLSGRWKWSRGKVRRYLLNLAQQNDPQIVQHKNNVITVISISNWNDYQANGTANNTTGGTTDGQQTDNRRTTNGHTKECINTTNHVKEKKEAVVFPYDSEDFKTAWNGYMESRKLNRVETTNYAKKLLIKKINELAENEAYAIIMLNEATVKGWKDLFHVKVDTTTHKYPRPRNYIPPEGSEYTEPAPVAKTPHYPRPANYIPPEEVGQ